MNTRRYPTVTVTQKQAKELRLNLDSFPSAGPYPNITGMKNKYWGNDALCIKCGVYVYHVDADTYRKAGGKTE